MDGEKTISCLGLLACAAMLPVLVLMVLHATDLITLSL